MSGRGVIYIVFGEQARQAARQSIASLRTHCDLPVLVIGDAVEGADEWMPWDGPHPYGQTPQGIRFLAGMVKPSMYRMIPRPRRLSLRWRPLPTPSARSVQVLPHAGHFMRRCRMAWILQSLMRR